MLHATRSTGKALLALATLSIVSACGQPERPRTVSDFCLLAKRLSAEPAPAAGVNDPGNLYDTDQTFAEVVAHNEVVDRMCPANL